MSHLLFLFMCDLTLKKGRIKSSSYGLSIDMALLLRVWFLAKIALHALYTGMGNLLSNKKKIHSCYTHELHGNFMT